MTKLLILGGTTEAKAIAEFCFEYRIDAIYSHAGVTNEPVELPIETRVGGFGGVSGLLLFLAENQITHLVDATHPFANQISDNASKAADLASVPLLHFKRPEWVQTRVDDWTEFNSAVCCLEFLRTQKYRNVFLATGRKSLGEFQPIADVQMIARMVDELAEDDISYSHITRIYAKGPFEFQNEVSLFREHKIDVVVSKNSGGTGAFAKIEAARKLRIPVLMIKRKLSETQAQFTNLSDLLTHLSLLGA